VTRQPIPTHIFEPADTTNHTGVRDCRRCPLGEDRTDVHEPDPTSPERAALEARLLGEGEAADAHD